MSMRCADVAGIDRHQPLLVEQLLGNQELIPSEGLELPDSISFAGYDQMRCSFALKVDPNHRKRYGELPKLIPCDIFEKRQQQRSAWKDIIQARARHAL